MAGRVVAFIAGGLLVVTVLLNAVRTLVLPRSSISVLTRRVFLSVRLILRLAIGRDASFSRRDAVMALFGPVSLLALLATWLVLVIGAYGAMLWGFENRTPRQAFVLSGSSAFTLGFAGVKDLPSTVLVFSEAAITLLLLALLIAYLPAIYSAFSRREAAVASLETRAGSPPSAITFLLRLVIIGGLEDLHEFWPSWEWWFVEIQETHTTFPALVSFRSPLADHSWVTAAGAVLDTAAIAVSALDRPRDPAAQLCLRAGWLSLRRIAEQFRIPFDHDPRPDDPISIRRDEFDALLAQLERKGVPLKPDRDQAWRDFAGWRVNYDTVLLDLATLVMAPPSPWTSDRRGPWSPWWVWKGRIGSAPSPEVPR